jgi:hypothetical protein
VDIIQANLDEIISDHRFQRKNYKSNKMLTNEQKVAFKKRIRELDSELKQKEIEK